MLDRAPVGARAHLLRLLLPERELLVSHPRRARGRATPRSSCSSSLASPVIPADTVKALHAEPGLVRKVSYRPSLRRQFEPRVRRLNGERARAGRGSSPTTPRRRCPRGSRRGAQIAVLDAAADLVDVLYARELVHKNDSAAARRKQRLLERRAQILQPSPRWSSSRPGARRPSTATARGASALGAATHGRALRAAAPSSGWRCTTWPIPTPGYPELIGDRVHARARAVLGGPDRARQSLVRSGSPRSRRSDALRPQDLVGVRRRRDHASTTARATTASARSCSGGTGAAFALWDRAVIAVRCSATARCCARPASRASRAATCGSASARAAACACGSTPDLIVLVTGALALASRPGTRTRPTEIEATLRWELVHDFALGIEGRRVPDGYEGQLLTFVYF